MQTKTEPKSNNDWEELTSCFLKPEIGILNEFLQDSLHLYFHTTMKILKANSSKVTMKGAPRCSEQISSIDLTGVLSLTSSPAEAQRGWDSTWHQQQRLQIPTQGTGISRCPLGIGGNTGHGLRFSPHCSINRQQIHKQNPDFFTPGPLSGPCAHSQTATQCFS